MLLGSLSACAAERPAPAIADETPAHTIYLINYAWHTGLVLARTDLPAGKFPELEDFPEAKYVEFGWGDREYYPAQDPSVGKALLAGLVPTSSVVKMIGWSGPPSVVMPATEAHALPVSDSGMQHLLQELDAVFDRPPDAARAEAVHVSTSGRMRFYPAHGRFHLFNTCNTWTARMLVTAGLPISTSGVVTSENLMRRVRPLTH